MTVCIPTFHKNAAILSSFSMKIECIDLGFFLFTFIIRGLKDKLQLALQGYYTARYDFGTGIKKIKTIFNNLKNDTQDLIYFYQILILINFFSFFLTSVLNSIICVQFKKTHRFPFI